MRGFAAVILLLQRVLVLLHLKRVALVHVVYSRGLGAANSLSIILVVALAEQISRIEIHGLAAALVIVLCVNLSKRILGVGQRLSHRLLALIVLRVCCILLLLPRCFPF